MSTELLIILGALHAAFVCYLLGSRLDLKTTTTIVVSSAATTVAGFLIGMALVILRPDFDPLIAVAGATVLAMPFWALYWAPNRLAPQLTALEIVYLGVAANLAAVEIPLLRVFLNPLGAWMPPQGPFGIFADQLVRLWPVWLGIALIRHPLGNPFSRLVLAVWAHTANFLLFGALALWAFARFDPAKPFSYLMLALGAVVTVHAALVGMNVLIAIRGGKWGGALAPDWSEDAHAPRQPRAVTLANFVHVEQLTRRHTFQLTLLYVLTVGFVLAYTRSFNITTNVALVTSFIMGRVFMKPPGGPVAPETIEGDPEIAEFLERATRARKGVLLGIPAAGAIAALIVFAPATGYSWYMELIGVAGATYLIWLAATLWLEIREEMHPQSTTHRNFYPVLLLAAFVWFAGARYWNEPIGQGRRVAAEAHASWGRSVGFTAHRKVLSRSTVSMAAVVLGEARARCKLRSPELGVQCRPLDSMSFDGATVVTADYPVGRPARDPQHFELDGVSGWAECMAVEPSGAANLRLLIVANFPEPFSAPEVHWQLVEHGVCSHFRRARSAPTRAADIYYEWSRHSVLVRKTGQPNEYRFLRPLDETRVPADRKLGLHVPPACELQSQPQGAAPKVTCEVKCRGLLPCRDVVFDLPHAAHPFGVHAVPEYWKTEEAKRLDIDGFPEAMSCFEVPVAYNVDRRTHAWAQWRKALILLGPAVTDIEDVGAFWLVDDEASCRRVTWDPVEGPYYRWSADLARGLGTNRQGLVLMPASAASGPE